MRPRTKREKAAAASAVLRATLARRYGTLRVAHVIAAFASGFILASSIAGILFLVVEAQ